MPRVVVTGLGLVCPLGNTVPQALQSALRAESGIRRCDDLLWGRHGDGLRCRIGGTVEGFDPRAHLPARWAEEYDPSVTFALAAAREAIEQSALPVADSGERVGVVIGTAGGGSRTWHRSLRRCFVDNEAHQLPGSLLLQLSSNIAAGLISLDLGLRGPTFGVTDACASGGTAMANAADAIRLGRADAMVVGGTEAAIGLVTYGSMLSAGAMCPSDDPVGACRPFSPGRQGLVMGEGAGVMVLERLDHAVARGATIYGELAGEAMTSDAYHAYSPDPTGRSWARTMRLALERAGVSPDEVDSISAHAASTPLGDRTEAAAIRQVFGDRAAHIPVAATKSQVGHGLGAGGAVETVLALAALREGFVLPTLHHTPDPQCPVNAAPTARRHRTTVLLKNSFGFAGTNTSLVFRTLSAAEVTR